MAENAGQLPKPDRSSLVPEFAKREATRLATTHDAICQEINKKIPGSVGGHAIRSDGITLNLRKDHGVQSIEAYRSVAVGGGYLWLRRNPGPNVKFAENFKQEFGFSPTDSIEIWGMHADVPTIKDYEALIALDQRQVPAGKTTYYFTMEGQFAKTISRPSTWELPETRKNLNEDSGTPEIIVPSDMTGGDFEIASAVYARLGFLILPPSINTPTG